MTLSFGGLGFPPCWRAYFFLLRQEKVAKKKATPGSAPLRGSLRYSAGRAACQNSPSAQTRQADYPRPTCVAQRLPRGPKNVSCETDSQEIEFHGQSEKRPKNENHRSIVDAFPGPLGGAEQRRGWRKRGEDCLRAKPEFRSPRQNRVAQGTGNAGTDPGVAFSLATFFWPLKRKYARPQGGNPSQLAARTPIQGKPHRKAPHA